MTNYRLVSRHVKYWRGAVHKWSTVTPFTGSLSSGNYASAIAAMKVLEMGVNYSSSTGVSGGGLYQIELYNSSSGGVPIASAVYFDPEDPGSWISYTAGFWTSRTLPIEGAAEVALQVQWPAGLGSSGKPVIFKKWYHAVPVNEAGPATHDVSAGDIASLQAGIDAAIATIGGLGVLMGNGSRIAALSSTVVPYYGNHQMPRGRRRKLLTVASGSASGPFRVVPVVPIGPLE